MSTQWMKDWDDECIDALLHTRHVEELHEITLRLAAAARNVRCIDRTQEDALEYDALSTRHTYLQEVLG